MREASRPGSEGVPLITALGRSCAGWPCERMVAIPWHERGFLRFVLVGSRLVLLREPSPPVMAAADWAPGVEAIETWCIVILLDTVDDTSRTLRVCASGVGDALLRVFIRRSQGDLVARGLLSIPRRHTILLGELFDTLGASLLPGLHVELLRSPGSGPAMACAHYSEGTSA